MTTPRTVSPAPTVATSENEVLYQLVKRAEINPMEVEDVARTAVEVTVLWNRTALHVAHLDDDHGFALTSVAPSLPSPAKPMLPALGLGGAAMLGGALAASLGVASLGALATVVGVGLGVRRHQQNEAVRQDGGRFVVDAEMLGAEELPVVMREGASARFVFAAGASGEVEIDGEKRSLAELTAQGLARPSSVLEGAFEVAMVPGGRYRMELSGLTIVAKAVRAGRRTVGPTGRDRALRGASLGAAAAVAALLGVMRFAAHDEAGMLSEGDRDDRMAELRDFLSRHSEQPEAPTPHEGAAVNDRGGQDGAAHAGPAGAMGRPDTAPTHRRYEIRRNGEPAHLTNRTAQEQVSNRGVFAALGGATAMTSNGASGIVSPFGLMTEAGDADESHQGNLTGDLAGDSGGFAGLDSAGPGWGGGGQHEQAIGTGHLNTLGRSAGCAEGEDCRYGQTRGTLRGNNRATHAPPHIGTLVPTVVGIPADVIRRVVLRNIGQINRCYEQGLATNPGLAGRVAVRFVIGSSGSVITSAPTSDTLGMPSVSACIAGAVQRWSFPVPADSGAITVTYPFSLIPADG
jgi:hypothetical protein